MFVDPNSGTNTAPTNNSGSAQSTGAQRDKRTVIGYVNLYVPLTDGTRIKLISDLRLQLYKENAGDVKLVDLVKSGAITTEQLAKLIQVEVSIARDKEVPLEFDLSTIGL